MDNLLTHNGIGLSLQFANVGIRVHGNTIVANRQFGNQVLPLPLDMPPLDAYLYWHANVDNEPANRWLREQVVDAVRRG